MKFSEQRIIQGATQRLRELLGAPPGKDPDAKGPIKIGPFTFHLEAKASGDTPNIVRAIEVLQPTSRKDTIPLLAVPYMGEAARRRCAEAKVDWVDLSGNAHIVAPGLHIHVEGHANKFKQSGRPPNVFAPKSARVARWLLIHPDRFMTQREIAYATHMEEGFVSRIVHRMEALELVGRNASGGIRARDPDVLLDAWAEAYDFSRHHIIRGHVPARSSEALLHQLSTGLQEHSATGLAAAWLLTRFAGFRTVTFYLREEPSPEMLDRVSFREEPRGANVWLVVPNDAGVFHGSEVEDGIPCVHRVQAWLDLSGHPERASEAADRLRDTMQWRSRA